MALETLKGLTEIDGEAVCELQEFASSRPKEFIVVNHKNNGISFQIQKGPINEVGKNGCQVTALIDAARIIISELNEIFPCAQNDETVYHLEQALVCQARRYQDRKDRDVEGTSQL